MYVDMSWVPYCGCLYFADENEKIGYIDISGKEIIPAQFDYLYYLDGLEYGFYSFGLAGNFYEDGYAIVRMGDKFGVIDKSGSYIVTPEFDGLGTWSSKD